ncbi:MAG: hydroxyacylglutathione hydrolase [Solirubrobacteraceae bacterium]|nr:hydroxyacylglutathione hydrolase [Solirubrobacteraceae bacterium]
MKQLADGVWQVTPFPFNSINAYLLEDVLVDAAARQSGKRILRQLDGHAVSAHAITHAHPDHQGASHEVCGKLGIPFWVGEADVAAAENPALIRELQPDHRMARFFDWAMTGPGHPVARPLREGDEVAGFTVLDVPGHSAGHVAFWRESDRVLVVGDVLTNMNTMTGIPGLHEPRWFFTPDPVRNRESARRFLPLEPSLVLFGHGPPLRDTRKFVDFVASLPSDA